MIYNCVACYLVITLLHNYVTVTSVFLFMSFKLVNCDYSVS